MSDQLQWMEPDPKAYWRARRLLRFYIEDKGYREDVAKAVLEHEPASVLDFGCNVGGTLRHIRDLDPSVTILGVDLNEKAVQYGTATWHLPLVVGDEGWLAKQKDDAYDVAYTISVLDHIPDPQPVLDELARIAHTLILVEPWVGQEGDIRLGGVEPNNQTWSWDIPKRLRSMGLKVNNRAFPLEGGADMGQHYRMYTARRKT